MRMGRVAKAVCALLVSGTCLVGVGLVGVGGSVAPALAENATPTRCPGDEYPCIVTWRFPSAYVDATHVSGNKSAVLETLVFLPKGYNGVTRFPVLYLLHGSCENCGNTSNTALWWRHPLSGILATAPDFPAVIVMPEGGDLGVFSNWWRGGLRTAPGWESHHLDELVPMVEERLRIRPGRRWRAIHGASMGGYGALYYAAQRPGYFGTVAASSPFTSLYDHFFWPQFGPSREVWGDPGPQAFYWKGHDPQYLVENLRYTRVYISYGDNDPRNPEYCPPAEDEVEQLFAPPPCLSLGDPPFLAYEYVERKYAQNLLERLRELGNTDTTFRIIPGQHTGWMHRRALLDAMAWGHFGEVTERTTNWTHRTVQTSGKMWNLRFRFPDNATGPAGAPDTLVTFTRRGNVLRGSAGDAGANETVIITTSTGATFTERLPFERELPDE